MAKSKEKSQSAFWNRPKLTVLQQYSHELPVVSPLGRDEIAVPREAQWTVSVMLEDGGNSHGISKQFSKITSPRRPSLADTKENTVVCGRIEDAPYKPQHVHALANNDKVAKHQFYIRFENKIEEEDWFTMRAIISNESMFYVFK